MANDLPVDAPQVGNDPRLMQEPNEGGAEARQLAKQLRRSERIRRPPARFDDFIMLTDCGEPSCYKDALLREDKASWELAMKVEMDSLKQNQTWDLVQLPKGKKALPCKWVYRLKITRDAKTRHKARLVAKGFKQEYGVDFDEIFSPVVKMTTLRTLLALVASEDMELVQMDVKTAFLHGDLHEEIYMQQPEGYEVQGKAKLVCKLKKSLYGLKQAPRQWYHKFDAFMKSQKFRRSDIDHCLYMKKDVNGDLLTLILYVDDMLIAGKSHKEIDALKARLHETFDMKDLGDANHILGMRIIRDRKKHVLYLSLKEYIGKVLQRFHMEGAKSISTPLPPYVKLSALDSPQTKVERTEMVKIPYASACGGLMYAMVATRPDIAFAVGVISRYMANPGKQHWEAVKGVMRYLKGTQDLCICFGRQDAKVHGYVDSDYAGHPDNRKSTTGYVFTFMGGAVSWISRMQRCTALSTTEAEYVAASEACKEALWLSRLVADLGCTKHIPLLHCDNQSAIQLARNPVFHSKTKHIDVKYHFIREVIEDKLVQLVKIHTDDNPTDLLTKSLRSERFAYCRGLMGIG